MLNVSIIMILVISDSCKYWRLPVQIAENPIELGLQFVAIGLSLDQRASK